MLMKVALKKEEIFVNSITSQYLNILIDNIIAKENKEPPRHENSSI